jgi:hypothetical protein
MTENGENMFNSRPLTHAARTVANVVCVTAVTAVTAVAGTAPPASASPADGMYQQLTVLCGAAGGDFYPARFGYWRCQEARLDGTDTFAAVRSVCERPAGRRFLEAIDYPVAGLGTWVCAPA